MTITGVGAIRQLCKNSFHTNGTPSILRYGGCVVFSARTEVLLIVPLQHGIVFAEEDRPIPQLASAQLVPIR